VSIVQVGFENRSTSKRDPVSCKARRPSSFDALIARIALLPDILVPQVCMRTYEFTHHADALLIVEHHDPRTVLPEEILSAQKVSILANHDTGNAKQQCGARAHDAGAQSADQLQLRPIPPAAGVAEAYGFGMRRRIAALHSQIMSAGHNLPLLVGQN
jgi:hypothetical protein